MEMHRRIEMGSIVRRQAHPLDSPALAIGQVLLLQAGEKRGDLLVGVFVGEVLDLGHHRRRIAQHVVLEVDRQIDELAGHAALLGVNSDPAMLPVPAPACRYTPAIHTRLLL